MADEEKAPKKLIIDEDWKQQARKEKEILAAKEEAEKATEQAEEQRGPLPEGDLAALISMLATQALFSLGLLQVKGQERREPDLELARYNIDMLETLEAKTKGNLTEDEAAVLKNTLSELRMGYVHVANAVEREA
ncbi:MAG: DUF1844 domain-containing protein [Sedimentisphaerales bacterium]|nr:DUF1844 domain-containing protein [Sedimentisphaerales bacterium]